MLIILVTFFSCQKEELDDLSTPENVSSINNNNTIASRISASLPGNAEQGAMLHAHTWPFDAIERAIPQIANAGFNSVQVSPVNKTKGNSPWWILYQPCDLNIGNVVLGNEDQFRRMCQTAENYGVKIIVDAVLNHVADNGTSNTWSDQLDPALKRGEYFHWNGSMNNFQDRWQLTQQDLLGLPDWNTQRSDVQQLHINFLHKCIDAGADGFRFDAAKHMETSGGEDGNWRGNYWENIMGSINSRGNLYNFGEVLPDVADNEEQYLRYYDITAHGYGRALRAAVRNSDATGVRDIWHGNRTLSPDKSLVYVENHDDYEHNDDNSRSLNTWQRKMGYAIAAARAGVTPRLLDRPGSEDVWKDLDVALINSFHNAMVRQNEYLRNPRRETLVVDRGNEGTAILNLGGEFNISTQTNLRSGTYSGEGGTFNVSGGTLTGNVKGGAIVVLYNNSSYGNNNTGNGGGNNNGDNGNPGNGGDNGDTGGGNGNTTTIYANIDVGWGNSLFIRGNTSPLNWNSGIQMTNVNSNTWKWEIQSIPQGQNFEFKVLINDNNWSSGSNFSGKGGETITINPNF
ncbi:alpha-amylase family glycosyl hydrolase [Tenacibaculum sp. M341]|uniref:alpha-amylase family glycosyl hydrolase n=1 Tax=Tenacibaculum sp. M341 TaxID=2530339 RepID=UPI00140435BB|nr:alpha-amylase family glycosyl hydrolase [Tenacibaculum sp. M341]